eukprot:GHVU01013241.1.p2 GENE.GHVU01013241.1~~GHVU01013241.1.p2  ORF type:complete len:120 (+),score=10.29 GHVU01013241.1:108-467(+)
MHARTDRHIYVHIHTCIHTYIHAYIHTYMHTYVHAYIRTWIQGCSARSLSILAREAQQGLTVISCPQRCCYRPTNQPTKDRRQKQQQQQWLCVCKWIYMTDRQTDRRTRSNDPPRTAQL